MSETSSLPTQDLDPSDNGPATYAIRLTPYEKFTFQQVVDFLMETPYFLKFVISRETPKEHFHIVIETDETFDLEDVRECIRSFFVPFWQDDKGKLPRGFGNKQYNLQLSYDPDAAVTYAVKLGDFVYEGYSEEYILECKAKSFDKKKPSNFKSEYIDLSNRFQDSQMDIREFMISYCDLKAKYDQQVNLHHAYGYALSNSIKRDKNAADFVENYLYKL